MKKIFLFPAVLSIFLLSAAVTDRQSRLPGSGTVTRVTDGDTITVRFSDGIERRIRLIGVDAPEMNDPRTEAAWRAFLSWRFAFHLLYRRVVRLTYDFPTRDEYRRVLAYVWTDEGDLFNDVIIRRGFAAALLKYPFRGDFQRRFREAASVARKEKRGFWRTEDPEVIPISEVRAHLGEIVSVRLRCAQAIKKKSFLYLSAAGVDFEAVIPLDRASFFPKAEDLAEKDLLLTGFLEEFGGRPQIMISFPHQLRLT